MRLSTRITNVLTQYVDREIDEQQAVTSIKAAFHKSGYTKLGARKQADLIEQGRQKAMQELIKKDLQDEPVQEKSRLQRWLGR